MKLDVVPETPIWNVLPCGLGWFPDRSSRRSWRPRWPARSIAVKLGVFETPEMTQR